MTPSIWLLGGVISLITYYKQLAYTNLIGCINGKFC